MSTTAASRFSLSAFRRYEPHLLAYSSTFPAPVLIDPYPFSLETFACRIRDAARAYLSHSYPSTLPTNFLSIWAATSVSIVPPHIRIAPRPTPTGTTTVLPLSTSNLSPPRLTTSGISPSHEASFFPSRELVVSKPTKNILRALMLLHDECVLSTPTKIENLDEELTTCIQRDADEMFFNVGVVFPTNTTAILT